ncbi:DUF413 domain-containing protein [Parashewanella curva]|uniref:Macrodomain Ori protein n=1 Tax=Parashewanella curva TaxID=2338552 RepID=A0A3L8PR97_9GAMM|nr:DUF413 domain-containing protein [Parashewanella curva]RLV57886.1 DUF413 domain-containing protein [Parashewanella curva]
MEKRESQSFSSKSRFYGEQYFPHGLARSGDFTRQQVTLLEAHGAVYEALHRGTIQPKNEEEQRFVNVCSGEAVAVSPHEKVWMTFVRKIEAQKSFSPFGKSTKKHPETVPSIDIDDHEDHGFEIDDE